MNTLLSIKTTVSDILAGDVFAYRPHPTPSDRLAPVTSVEAVGGKPLADGTGDHYAANLHRICYTDSDHLGTLFYGDETIFRAKRTGVTQ